MVMYAPTMTVDGALLALCTREYHPAPAGGPITILKAVRRKESHVFQAQYVVLSLPDISTTTELKKPG